MRQQASKRSIGFVVWAATSLLLVGGCASTDSGPVPTSDVRPAIRVVVDTVGDARIEVTLRSGFRVLTLTDGETLTVRLNDDAPVTMVQGTGAFGLSATYVADIVGDAIGADDTLTIAWNRTELTDAPATVVTVPPRLSGPGVTDTSLTFDDDVSVTWTPDGLGGEVDARLVVTACTGDTPEDLAAIAFLAGFPDTFDLDAGSGTMDAIVLGTEFAPCTAIVEIGRATGDIDLDPAFDGLDSQSSVVHLGAEVGVTFDVP